MCFKPLINFGENLWKAPTNFCLPTPPRPENGLKSRSAVGKSVTLQIVIHTHMSGSPFTLEYASQVVSQHGKHLSEADKSKYASDLVRLFNAYWVAPLDQRAQLVFDWCQGSTPDFVPIYIVAMSEFCSGAINNLNTRIDCTFSYCWILTV